MSDPRATVKNPHPPQHILFDDVLYPLQKTQFVVEWRPADKGEFYLHTDKSGRNEQVMARMERDDNYGVIRPVVVGVIDYTNPLKQKIIYVSGGNK